MTDDLEKIKRAVKLLEEALDITVEIIDLGGFVIRLHEDGMRNLAGIFVIRSLNRTTPK